MADARVLFSVAHCDQVLCKIKCINKLARFFFFFFFLGGGGRVLYIPSALWNIVGLLIFEVTPCPQLAKETNILENKPTVHASHPEMVNFVTLPALCLNSVCFSGH